MDNISVFVPFPPCIRIRFRADSIGATAYIQGVSVGVLRRQWKHTQGGLSGVAYKIKPHDEKAAQRLKSMMVPIGTPRMMPQELVGANATPKA